MQSKSIGKLLKTRTTLCVLSRRRCACRCAPCKPLQSSLLRKLGLHLTPAGVLIWNRSAHFLTRFLSLEYGIPLGSLSKRCQLPGRAVVAKRDDFYIQKKTNSARQGAQRVLLRYQVSRCA